MCVCVYIYIYIDQHTLALCNRITDCWSYVGKHAIYSISLDLANHALFKDAGHSPGTRNRVRYNSEEFLPRTPRVKVRQNVDFISIGRRALQGYAVGRNWDTVRKLPVGRVRRRALSE